MSWTRPVLLGLLIGLVVNVILWAATGYNGLIHPPWWAALLGGFALGLVCVIKDAGPS